MAYFEVSDLTFISLFAGIGGIDLGFERAGMTCVAQVERDDWCREVVLKKHWPHIPKYSDILDVGLSRKNKLPPADILAGGFPCQPNSSAGKQRGEADDRNLWPEFNRLINEEQPLWVVAENVIGLKETLLDTVLFDLEDSGYETTTFNIPACSQGAAQIRERLFILGRRVACPESVRRRFRKSSKPRQDIGKGDTSANGREILAGTDESRRLSNGIAAPPATRGTQKHSGTWGKGTPRVARMVDGLSPRLDRRTRALGNAVHPAVAQWLGEHIIKTEIAYQELS